MDEGAVVNIIGGGLSGSECSLQLASRRIKVKLYEMRPIKSTEAHKSGYFAELVCSNSFRSDETTTAVGILKQELRTLGSYLLKVADETRVPAGLSLAVSRDDFAKKVTEEIKSNPYIEIVIREVEKLPQPPVVVATGPLTSETFYKELENIFKFYGLYYYDATSPIISADSIDFNKVFMASRYNKGTPDFINCPLNRAKYLEILNILREAPTFLKHNFDDVRFFEGCLPVEVMAKRGIDTLKFGPWKPVGLTENSEIEAVIQLRKDDLYGKTFNIVGFQTQLLHNYQKKIINLIPGLENAEILRYGSLHKNIYINSPRFLNRKFEIKEKRGFWVSGQITGVEGYVESIASGLATALSVYARLKNIEWDGFPSETMIGALSVYIEKGIGELIFQPSNIQFGLVPPLASRTKKSDKKLRYKERAEESLKKFIEDNPWILNDKITCQNFI
ncbi:MAG: methylenetetrahydrofolate--tRNA-(uracil(54)-C(5))-methyltransferase (FADH(2)-oxidizing) TrmFO [Candidatus Hydrogenedentota bacterium]